MFEDIAASRSDILWYMFEDKAVSRPDILWSMFEDKAVSRPDIFWSMFEDKAVSRPDIFWFMFEDKAVRRPDIFWSMFEYIYIYLIYSVRNHENISSRGDTHDILINTKIDLKRYRTAAACGRGLVLVSRSFRYT
jgi:hypothetical protein